MKKGREDKDYQRELQEERRCPRLAAQSRARGNTRRTERFMEVTRYEIRNQANVTLRLAWSWGISFVLHLIVLTLLALFVMPPMVSRAPEIILLSLLPEKKNDQRQPQERVTRDIKLPLLWHNRSDQREPISTNNHSTAQTSASTLPVVPAEIKSSLSWRLRDSRRTTVDDQSRKRGQSLQLGLNWLRRQQQRDGRWELHEGYPDAGSPVIRTATGATALSLLAFLGAGETHLEGQHAEVIQRGLTWLVSNQDRQTGDLHDLRHEEGRNAAFYAHALGTIALSEALALTHDESLRPAVQGAVRYLLDSQHPEQGGWKYRPLSRMMQGDLSVTGWALMALHAARLAGVDVPHDDFVRATRFLDAVQAQQGARYRYEPLDPESRTTAALTAEGLLCRQWLGWPLDFPAQQDALDWLASEHCQPEWSAGKRNVYAWYYTAQVLHNAGGPTWTRWFQAVSELLIKHQVTQGSSRSPKDVLGSWHPTQPLGDPLEYADKAGRLYFTVMCLLILETPGRYPPLYHQESMAGS